MNDECVKKIYAEAGEKRKRVVELNAMNNYTQT